MLKGPTRVWFSKLTPISTFKELSGHFVIHFIGGPIQEVVGKPAEYQATGRRKLEILYDSVQ